MWISASGQMRVLGWNARRPLWSWWKRTRLIKATTNTPLLYISWGQCWITKTCHHETPDLDWFLLQSTVRSNFELPKTSSCPFFFLHLCEEKVARRKWSEISSAFTPPPKKMMQWTPPWVLYSKRRLHLVYSSASTGRWSSKWQKHNTKLKTWIRENPTRRHLTRKTGGFFL